jgi:probable HAF family extracellular repeat protein
MSGLADGSYHAFRYTDGVGMVDLGTLGGELSIGEDINDLGQVVGTSESKDGFYHAFFYSERSGMVDLGRGNAMVINNHGDIAGTSPVASGPVFFRDGTIVPVPSTMFGHLTVNDMNDHNRFVGTTWTLESPMVAYLGTESNGLVNLNTLIATNSGWRINTAFGINNHGQIAGTGVVSGRELAYRLDPIPPKLAVSTAGTNVVVSWAPAWPGVFLESTSTLTSTNWTLVPSGGTNVVTVASDSSARFFRINLEALRGLCCAP